MNGSASLGSTSTSVLQLASRRYLVSSVFSLVAAFYFGADAIAVGVETPAKAENSGAITYHAVDEQLRSLNFTMLLDVTAADSQLSEFEELIAANFLGTWRPLWLKAWRHEMNLVSKLSPDRRKVLVRDFQQIHDIENELTRITSVAPVLSRMAPITARIAEVLDSGCPTYAYVVGIEAGLKGLNGDFRAAVADWERVRELHCRWVGTDNLMYVADSEIIASASINLRQYAKARKLLDECLTFYSAANLGDDSHRIRAVKSTLAMIAIHEGRYDEGIAAIERLVFKGEPQSQQDISFESKCLHHLGIAYGKTKRPEVAEASFESALNAYRKLSFVRGHPTILRILADQLQFYEENHKKDKANQLRKEIEQLKQASK